MTLMVLMMDGWIDGLLLHSLFFYYKFFMIFNIFKFFLLFTLHFVVQIRLICYFVKI